MKNIKYLSIVIIMLIILTALFIKISLSFFFPREEMSLISNYSQKYNVDPALVAAMAHTESGFDKDAVSHKGASGYMQIMEQTANWAAEEIGIKDFNYDMIKEPKINIEIGCWYISKLINQYGSVDTALAAYNAGSGNVSNWLKDYKYSNDGKTLYNIPFNETKDYIKKVNRRKILYDRLIKIFERGQNEKGLYNISNGISNIL